MTTTRNTLVVVDPTEPNEHLVQRAAASATGADSGLVVLSVMSLGEYQGRQRAVADIRDLDYEYTHDQAVQSSRNVARRIADEALAESDVLFEPVGMVGRVRNCILEAAETYDCDHVVVAGHRRRVRDVLLGVRTLPSWLERTFPGHVSVYFDNSPVEPAVSSELDEPMTPLKPA